MAAPLMKYYLYSLADHKLRGYDKQKDLPCTPYIARRLFHDMPGQRYKDYPMVGVPREVVGKYVKALSQAEKSGVKIPGSPFGQWAKDLQGGAKAVPIFGSGTFLDRLKKLITGKEEPLIIEEKYPTEHKFGYEYRPEEQKAQAKIRTREAKIRAKQAEEIERRDIADIEAFELFEPDPELEASRLYSPKALQREAEREAERELMKVQLAEKEEEEGYGQSFEEEVSDIGSQKYIQESQKHRQESQKHRQESQALGQKEKAIKHKIEGPIFERTEAAKHHYQMTGMIPTASGDFWKWLRGKMPSLKTDEEKAFAQFKVGAVVSGILLTIATIKGIGNYLKERKLKKAAKEREEAHRVYLKKRKTRLDSPAAKARAARADLEERRRQVYLDHPGAPASGGSRYRLPYPPSPTIRSEEIDTLLSGGAKALKNLSYLRKTMKDIKQSLNKELARYDSRGGSLADRDESMRIYQILRKALSKYTDSLEFRARHTDAKKDPQTSADFLYTLYKTVKEDSLPKIRNFLKVKTISPSADSTIDKNLQLLIKQAGL